MSNYTKTTDFEAKDSLPTGDSGKIIRGAEFETEFDAISTAIATKADTAGPTFTGTLTFETISDGTIGVTAFVDEDDMSSDSATLVPTQQSVKAYVDSQVTAQDLDFQADSGGALSIDLDSETLTFTGGTGIDTSGSGNAVTFAIDSTVATLTGTQTLTNKTLTSPDVNTPDIDGGTIDGTVIGGTTAAAGSFTTVSATGNITVNGTVDGRDVATDGSKLDGIEAGATADQTAAEIRTLVGSASDSNVFTDADHSKLDGIEAGATGDQTNAEIRAAVEAATDSNVFTDADHSKLDGIEASADVTDTANVTAAGAVMDSELTSEASVKALNQGVATTDSPTFAGVTVNGNVEFDGLSGTGSVNVTDILDQDDMSSNSATALATQQSIKAYVDSQVATVDTLAEVLGNGNTTGGTDITVGTGDDITFADNSKAIFGAGSDLQIYHDGTHSYVDDSSGTGRLILKTDYLEVQNAAGNEAILGGIQNGAVSLFYDGNTKLATTSTGINVTGLVESDEALIAAGTGTDAIQTLRMGSGGGGTNKASINFQNSAASEIFSIDFNNSTGTFDINGDLGGTALSIARAGAATFNNTITIPSQIIHSGDTDTYLEFSAANTWRVVAGNEERFKIASGEVTVNESSQDTDFRVESNSATHMLFVDAGNERLHVNGTTGTATFNVAGSSSFANTATSGALVASGATLSIQGTGTYNSNYFGTDRATVAIRSNEPSNDGWNPTLNIATIRQSLGTNQNATGGIGFTTIDDSNNTGIDDAARIQVINTNGASNTSATGLVFYNNVGGSKTQASQAVFKLAPYEAVFNEDSLDIDFRVESNNKSHMLFVDASADAVIIGDSGSHTSDFLQIETPASGGGHGIQIRRNDSNTSQGIGHILFGNNTDTDLAKLAAGTDGATDAGYLVLATQATGDSLTDRLTINSQGNVVFNETGTNSDFRVESDANTHAIFVDASTNRVGILNNNPAYAFHVDAEIASSGYFRVDSSSTYAGTALLTLKRNGNNTGDYLQMRDGSNNLFATFDEGGIIFNEIGGDTDFRVESDSNANAIFVDASTNEVQFYKNNGSLTTAGAFFQDTGRLLITTNNNIEPLILNRQDNDGILVELRQANAVEGTISVSGSTVSYNGFAGRHESSGVASSTAKGTVVSTIDELDTYLSGAKQGQTRADHAKVKVSDVVGDACVYGVVDDFTAEGKVNVVSVGIGAVRVTGACSKGDLLESNGDGTAKVQSDDIVRSKTIGKVTIGDSNTGVKLVSCVLYCG